MFFAYKIGRKKMLFPSYPCYTVILYGNRYYLLYLTYVIYVNILCSIILLQDIYGLSRGIYILIIINN